MRLFAVKRQHTQGLFAHTHIEMHEVFFWKNKARFLFSCQKLLFRMLAYSQKKEEPVSKLLLFVDTSRVHTSSIVLREH